MNLAHLSPCRSIPGFSPLDQLPTAEIRSMPKKIPALSSPSRSRNPNAALALCLVPHRSYPPPLVARAGTREPPSGVPFRRRGRPPPSGGMAGRPRPPSVAVWHPPRRRAPPTVQTAPCLRIAAHGPSSRVLRGSGINGRSSEEEAR